MALVNQNLTLEIVPGAIPETLHVTEYDENMQVTVQLLQRGQPFEIPSGVTAKVEGTLAGHPFSVDATPSGDTLTFELDKSMTAFSGRAWTKIRLEKDSKPVSTCGFWLDCDRAGVEAGAVIQGSGFQEQINQGVAAYFDGDPPFFELPEGGQSGQTLLSDGAGGAYWGQAQGGGSGLTNDIKQALLDCFENVAWIGDDGQDYYDALYAALSSVPSANLVSISAVFSQGNNVIYDTDSLNTLKQYLTVTAHYSDSPAQTVAGYTLSGTLSVGTSTITVSYGGKTTTFNVAVSRGNVSDMNGWTSGVAYTNLEYVLNEWPYVTDGSIRTGTTGTWKRTGYVPCDGASTIYFPTMENHTDTPFNNWFYDSNHDPVSNFHLSLSQPTTVTVPQNAAYFIVGYEKNAIDKLVSDGIIPYGS